MKASASRMTIREAQAMQHQNVTNLIAQSLKFKRFSDDLLRYSNTSFINFKAKTSQAITIYVQSVNITKFLREEGLPCGQC